MNHESFVLRSMGSLALLFLAIGCGTASAPDKPVLGGTRPPGETTISAAALLVAMTGTVDFGEHVRPVLKAKCLSCHQDVALPGQMDLTNRTTAERSGALGRLIVPGQPHLSLFLTRISSAPGHLTAMPPVGEQVSVEEIAVLRRWIEQGANWPRGREGDVKSGS